VQAAVATLLVAGCPVAIVWWLRASGAVSSAAVALLIGMALSLGVSYVGRVAWESLPGSDDLLFNELMIWGFLHRWQTQRRLASALDMIGPMSDPQRRALDGSSTKDKAKLLERLVAGMETRDPYLHGHSRRVARHSWMIARRMGLSRAEVARIRTAAAIHDVGKVETPKSILHKAGPLTDQEYAVIKEHPGAGALMAAVLRDTDLTSMIRHHHERLDGTGYPDGLSRDEIPLGARIIAVADTFDAITSARPYRPASPHKKAIDVLREEAGTRLDPAVVRAFCNHYAGRGPLALWSFVAGLPMRVVSWFSGSLATVASAAKVVAVAAFVGGTAVTTSSLASPIVKPHPTTHPGGTAGLRAGPSQAGAPRSSLSANASAVTRGAGRSRPAVFRAPRQGGSSGPKPAGTTPAQASGPGNTAPGSAQRTEPGKTDPPVLGKVEPPREGKTELPTKGKVELPTQGKTEPPAKGKVEVPVVGKVEPPVKIEPPVKVKVELPAKPELPVKVEVPVKAKVELPPKTELPVKIEPPVKVKVELPVLHK
jgi:hypothetical protein